MDEKQQTPEQPERARESSGEFLFRVLKPAGCILVLIIFILSLIFCFTYRSPAPAETAAPQQTAETTSP